MCERMGGRLRLLLQLRLVVVVLLVRYPGADSDCGAGR
jgi:hypothetical protein